MNALHFANPGWLWAMAAALPVAIAYLFHRRHRPLRVTGLFLWGVPECGGDGGRAPEPPTFGRAFLFDLLAALLLGLALAGPSFRVEAGLPVVVVLDDSFSMRSRDCHERARDAAGDMLNKAAARGLATAVILAGERPRILSGLDIPGAEAAMRLDAYLPSERAFDPAAALALALEAFGPGLDMHVFTNRRTGIPAGTGNRTSLHRLAGRGGNLAFTDIRRERRDGGDRLFVKAMNIADAPASGTLRLASANDPDTDLYRRTFEFGPNAAEAAIIDTNGTAEETLLLRIDAADAADVLVDDSSAALPPTPVVTTTYLVDVPDGAGARFFRLGLEAAGCVAWTPAETPGGGDAPDLLVTDGSGGSGRALTLRVMPEKSPVLLSPPYVVDLADPLCRDVNPGLSRWAAADSESPIEAERPLLLHGKTPLFWRESAGILGMNVFPAAGDVAATPAWPALLANVAEYASARIPGFGATAYRPGAELSYRPEPGSEGKVAVVSPRRGVAAEARGRGPALPMACGYYDVTLDGERVGGVSVLPLYGDASQTTGLADADAVAILSDGGSDSGAGVLDLSWLALALAVLLVADNWRRAKR